jgi:hypothetical protein
LAQDAGSTKLIGFARQMNYKEASDLCHNTLKGAMPIPGSEAAVSEIINFTSKMSGCGNKYWLPLRTNGTAVKSKINDSAQITFAPWKSATEKEDRDVDNEELCVILNNDKYEKVGCKTEACSLCQVTVRQCIVLSPSSETTVFV